MCFGETPKPGKPSNSTPGSGTTTPCHLNCAITSETKKHSPADRARTKIGVGEEVTLTVTGNPATWAITSGGGTLSKTSGTHSSLLFTADDKTESVTITATGSGCGCVNTITFSVVQPSGWIMKRQSGTNLQHAHGRPDCGWKGIAYLQPTDVNFYNVEGREKDSQYVGNGSYASYNGDWHGNYPPPDRVSVWVPVIGHTDADGSELGGIDTVYTGDPGAGVTGSAPPFVKGDGHFPIVWQWHVIGNATIHDFSPVRQEDEIFTTGKCESRKGGNTEKTMYSDPSSTY